MEFLDDAAFVTALGIEDHEFVDEGEHVADGIFESLQVGVLPLVDLAQVIALEDVEDTDGGGQGRAQVVGDPHHEPAIARGPSSRLPRSSRAFSRAMATRPAARRKKSTSSGSKWSGSRAIGAQDADHPRLPP